MRQFVLSATLLAVGLALGCARDVELIDRTQANKVEKSIFDPAQEWFFRATVVGTQFNQGLLFEGLEGEMDRIRWRIEKDRLIAYRSYEWLEGAEQTTGTVHFEGAPVAVFAILEHFDVQRGYNPATGEQDNVLEENTSDRPWYDRKYMRVDWSQNLLDGGWWSLEETVSILGSAPYYIQEHEVDNPWRQEITPDSINVVQSYLLETDFWTCYYVFLDPYFCGASEAKMKLSFMRVQPRDYEVLYYPDVQILRETDGTPLYRQCYVDGTCDKAYLPVFERFGFFRHEHRQYDPEYQWLRDGRIFLGHRWNMWQRVTDVAGNKIPASERQPGAITYYLNSRFPSSNDVDNDGLDDSLWMATAATRADVAAGRARRIGFVTDWDEAFRETFAGVKRQNPAYRGVTMDVVPPIFTIKPNSCNVKTAKVFALEHKLMNVLREYGIAEIERGNLERACTLLEWASDGEFTWQKPGDLRYSFVHWVDTPQQAGPLGYGPSAADPVTGEIISANANIYGAAIDELAAYAADIVALMNDQLPLEDLVEGRNVREHIAGSRMRANRALSPEKLQAFNQRMRELHQDPTFAPARMRMKMDRSSKHLELDRASVLAAKEDLLPTATRAANKLNALKGSQLEKELLAVDEIKRAMLGPDRYQPGVPLSGDLADTSVLDWMTGDVQDQHRKHVLKLAERSIMLADWTDPGMVSLAMELEDMTWEEIYDFMRREVFLSVTAHEVGHTFGLRHNFRGSLDAMNYGPEFWSYYHYDPATGRGWIDKDAGADQHMYASIMDYDSRFYADSMHGIGMYDKAAIKFGYGMLVEVFDTPLPLYHESLLDLYDYTDIPRAIGGTNCTGQNGSYQCENQDALDSVFGDGYCGTADDAEAAALAAEDAGNWALATQKWNEYDVNAQLCDRYLTSYFLGALDGATPMVENIHARTEVTWDNLVENWTNYYRYWNLGENVNYELPDEVPYKYCPDEYAYYTWVECKPYDKGANTLEVTRDRMERYDAYYFFTNFKRDRAGFNDYFYVNSYLSRLYDRFFSQMSNAFIYGLYGGSFFGYDKNGNEVTLADFSLGSDWQAAGLEGLNFLTSILEQPEPGSYCYDLADPRNQLTGQPTGYVGGGGVTAFAGMRLRNAPIEPGTLNVVTAGGVTLTDDGAGNLTGAGGSGTIAYGTGEVALTFAAPPPAGPIEADYVTRVFRQGCNTGTVIDVPVGVGKHYLTKWTDEYYYKATRLGTFYDKYAATFALTDNEGFFYRDFASYFDVGAFALSYWSGGLQDEVLEVFNSVFSGDSGTFAWRYDNGSTADPFKPAPVVDLYDLELTNDELMSLPRIEAATSWSLRWYGVVLPMLRYNAIFDYTEDFSNYTKICLEGYVDCMTFDPAVGATRYTDPLTHYTYLASNTDRPEFAIGANLLREAQAYADNVYAPAEAAYEALRTLPACAGAPEAVACTDNPATAGCNEAELCQRRAELLGVEREINRRSSFLDILREIGAMVDF